MAPRKTAPRITVRTEPGKEPGQYKAVTVSAERLVELVKTLLESGSSEGCQGLVVVDERAYDRLHKLVYGSRAYDRLHKLVYG